MKKEASPYNPANMISLLRIVLVPFFVVLLHEGRDLPAFILFVAASLSDFLDGFLARRYHWQTHLGEFIDPLGDKLLTLSAFVLLTLQARLPFWVVVLAFSRELTVVSGYLLLAVLARMTEVRVSRMGKLCTLLQMLALAFFLAGPWLAWGPAAQEWMLLAVELSVALNFVGGMDYALRGIHEYGKSRRAKRP
jgi:CDP-diacylglycerol--glycerol-3-phosphate 3-phosphatidyltransferase